MADMIVTLNGKELKAKALTLGDWEFLGQYLKSRLLSDLKLVEDTSLRRDLQMEIQMRDYGSLDVVNCRRMDVFLKIWYLAFGHNTGLTEGAVKEFINDDNIWSITRDIFIASGIQYKAVEEEEESVPLEPDNLTTSE